MALARQASSFSQAWLWSILNEGSILRKRRVLLGGALLVFLVGIIGAVGYLPHLGERYLRAHFGAGFSIGDLKWGLRGIRAKKVVLKDSRGELVLKAQRILLIPDVAAFFKGKLIVDQARVKSLFLRVERLKDGRMLFPGEAVPKISRPREKNRLASSRGSLSVRIVIRRLVIKKGSLLFIDHSVTPPLQVRIRGVDLSLEGVKYPFQESRLLSELYKVLPPNLVKEKRH